MNVKMIFIAGFLVQLALMLVWLIASPSEYEAKVANATSVSQPWERYQALAGDVDPNAWNFNWRNPPRGFNEWADASAAALEDALKAQTPAALSYVCHGQFSSRRVLDSYRRGYCPGYIATADPDQVVLVNRRN